MKVGVLSVEMLIEGARSLKQKRSRVSKIKTLIRNKFNVSVAEIGAMDKWQSTVLGIAAVSKDMRYLTGMMDSVIEYIEDGMKIQVIDYEREIL